MLRAVLSCGPAASLWCHPADNLTEVILPIRWSSSMYIHFSLTHGNNHCHRHAEIFFDDIQVASGLQAAKQHSCPFRRLANRPCSYGWEAVIVLLDDFIQGRPESSVIARILDVFLPGLRPLQHLTSKHGWAYLRTLASFTWEKAAKSWSEHVLEPFTYRRVYTQTLLHTDTLTRKHFHTHTHTDFYTQTLSHTGTFAHNTHFHTQRLLHTDDFTLLHTEAFTHTDAFTHRHFYTQTLWHTNTQAFLHTEALTHRRFYTQTLLHIHAFTHKHFHTQRLLHTGAFTHRSFYTQTLSHTRSDRSRDIAILPQFLAIEPHFVRKSCAGQLANRTFTSVFGDRTSFRAKGLRPDKRNRNFTPVFADRTSFRAKGLRPDKRNRNFTPVFGDRT